MEPARWHGVELRHFAALKAVAEERSFGRAAERLGYTQSAVSQQIATLERAVGERLVERPGGPRAVSLTAAGELLLRHAEAIVARLQAAQADLAALTEGTTGVLRVGTYQSVGARVLPTLLTRFAERWPAVEIGLVESAEDQELLDLVERGELDVTFAMLPLPEGPFESVELMRDPYVLVVAAGSELAERGSPPRLREIADLPLIGFRQCRSIAHVEQQLRVAAGAEPEVVFRSDDNGTVQALVAAGMGAAFVPLLTVDASDERVRVLEPAGKLPPRLIAAAWHRDRYRSPAARAFVELAAEVCSELERERPAAAAEAA
jgi:DNA-binding transcriptional LysR family regulator